MWAVLQDETEEVLPPKLCSLVFLLDRAREKVLLGQKKRGFGEGKCAKVWPKQRWRGAKLACQDWIGLDADGTHIGAVTQ